MVQDKERLLEWCRMRIEGYTLQEIADKYGVSREWVRASIDLHIAREKRNPCLYIQTFTYG